MIQEIIQAAAAASSAEFFSIYVLLSFVQVFVKGGVKSCKQFLLRRTASCVDILILTKIFYCLDTSMEKDPTPSLPPAYRRTVGSVVKKK